MASTGFAEKVELDWMRNRLSRSGKTNLLLCLFNCVSEYPSSISMLDLGKFKMLRDYSNWVGLSDHSIGQECIVASFLAGARLFEKHLTLSRSDGGPDGFYSLEPDELKSHLATIKAMASNESFWRLSVNQSSRLKSGKGSLRFARSVYATKNVELGDIVTLDCAGSFRPSHSEPAWFLDQMLGRSFAKPLKAGDPIMMADLADA